jgi:hypothetical protein
VVRRDSDPRPAESRANIDLRVGLRLELRGLFSLRQWLCASRFQKEVISVARGPQGSGSRGSELATGEKFGIIAPRPMTPLSKEAWANRAPAIL